MNSDEKRITEQISENLSKLLQGEKILPIEYDDCPESLEMLVKRVNETLKLIYEIYNFIEPLSLGKLSDIPPKSDSKLILPFKALHSRLSTLIWQVEEIAKGDYKQRVTFLNDFSKAFNSLVKQMEDEAERLMESEARLALTAISSENGIFVFNPKSLKILDSNEKFISMTGYTKEDIFDLSLKELYTDTLVFEEDIKNILNKSLHAIKNRKIYLKTGGNLTVDINSCHLSVMKTDLIMLSITKVEPLKVQVAADIKYKALIDNAKDIIIFIGLDGKILDINKAAERAFGYSRDEFLSMSVFELHNLEDRIIIERYLQKAVSGGITYETVHICKDGGSFPAEVSSQSFEIDNIKMVGVIIRNISDRKRIEDDLRYFALYDVLTRVPNRRVLEDAYLETFSLNQEVHSGALLLIDVDNLKFINDTFGHTIGDLVLVNLVSILKEELKPQHVLSRMGGDEFAILITNTSIKEVSALAEKLRRLVEKSKLYSGNYESAVRYTISIGIAPIQIGCSEFREVISRADFALGQSKDQGRNRVYCITDDRPESRTSNETNNLKLLISDALESDKFVLFFQPIVNIQTGETIHHEALMRIITQTGEIIYPGKLIPVAERFGLMSQIDKKVVTLAFDALEKYPDLKVFANLSGVSIGDEDLYLLIEENIRQRGIDPSRLGFEITETIAVKDLASADRWIRRLRHKGCKFALDDFGIGFSSFSYLQYLSVDYVKIDGSYIQDLDKNHKNRALVQAMNTVARSLGKKVIAEFVENGSILDILGKDNVSHAQGYFLGHPEPAPKISSISA